MKAKRTVAKNQSVKIAIWLVAVAIVLYVGISFVQGYMKVGAAALILPTGVDRVVKGSKPTDSVCSTCAETGRLAPKCAGSCDEGKDCKLVIDTGLCTCV